MICVKAVKIEFIYDKSVESRLWQRNPEEATGSEMRWIASLNVVSGPAGPGRR